MKKLYTILSIVLLSTVLFQQALLAQSPESFSYQAVVRDAENMLIANQQIGIQVTILESSEDGFAVYTETHTPTTNENGLLTIAIGEGETVGDMFAIDWTSGIFFIKTEIDLNGGTDYTITGISQILSVPFAMHAATADYVTGEIIYDEEDPVFAQSVANAITANDTTNWNTKLSAEVDGSITNELQALSISNDTIFLTDGGFVKLPAGTAFSGSFNDLADVPTGLADGDDDTQLTEAEVDAFVANNGYLTAEVDGSVTNELQAISISNDTIFLSDGGFVKLPSSAGFSGSFNELSDVPTGLADGDDDTQLTEAEVDAFVANNGYISAEVDGSVSNELQAISISNDTIFLSDGGFVKLPASSGFSGSFNDLSDVPANLDTDATDDFDGAYSSLTGAPTNVSTFTNDAGYLTTEADGDATNELELPTQTGQSGKLLTTDGTNPAWTTVTTFSGSYNDLSDVPANLDTDATDDFDGAYGSLTGAPTNVSTFTNDAGYLTAEADGDATNELELPTQTGQSGKLLTTDGTNPAWTTVTTFSGSFNDLSDVPANLDTDDTDDFDGNYNNLTNKPTNVSTFTNDAGYLTSESEIPSQTGNSGKYLTTNGTSVSWAAVSSGASQLSELSDVNTSTATSGNILVADGTDFESVAVGGDVTMASNGNITIANNSVDGTDIALGSDAQGDIMYYNGTDWVRLAAGTSGQILQTNGAGSNPTWEDAPSGGGTTITTISSNTTLGTDDQIVFINGAYTATFPSSPVDGQKLVICATNGSAGVNGNGNNLYLAQSSFASLTFNDGAVNVYVFYYSSTLGVWLGVY